MEYKEQEEIHESQHTNSLMDRHYIIITDNLTDRKSNKQTNDQSILLRFCWSIRSRKRYTRVNIQIVLTDRHTDKITDNLTDIQHKRKSNKQTTGQSIY